MQTLEQISAGQVSRKLSKYKKQLRLYPHLQDIVYNKCFQNCITKKYEDIEGILHTEIVKMLVSI